MIISSSLQLGMAQRLFVEKTGKHPFPFSPKEHSFSWPTLDKLMASTHLNYVDYALAQRLLTVAQEHSEATAALICHLSIAARQGHLCVAIDKDVITPSPQEIWLPSENQENPLPADFNLDSLILQGATTPTTLLTFVDEEKKPSTPLCRWNNLYYLQRCWQAETFFLTYLQALVHGNAPTPSVDNNNLAATVNTLQANGQLEPEQAAAIIKGCQNALTIITGGPGTGKTYTAGELLRILWENISFSDRQQCRIVLAAPTGKAAANLEASIRRAMASIDSFPEVKGQTLHSLLELKSSIPKKSYRVLNADIIIVDESSMMDVTMMGQLLGSLKPGARLILLGDPYQLPPIEAGSLFSDLVTALKEKEHPHVALTELKRCLRAELQTIVELANKIKAGDTTATLSLLQTTPFGIAYRAFDNDTKAKEIQKQLLDYALPKFPLVYSLCDNPSDLLHAFSNFRILTPLRQGSLGVEELNALFFQAMAARARHHEAFVVPIMITRNSQRLALVNGEIGLLLKFQEPHRDIALFVARNATQQNREISALLLPPFEYAYCISIHKSQGSEFDNTLILLPPGAEAFGREALYTAITRARHSLEIWGSQEVLTQTIDRCAMRHSGIIPRLSLPDEF